MMCPSSVWSVAARATAVAKSWKLTKLIGFSP
jgi:hypothetical protein